MIKETILDGNVRVEENIVDHTARVFHPRVNKTFLVRKTNRRYGLFSVFNDTGKSQPDEFKEDSYLSLWNAIRAVANKYNSHRQVLKQKQRKPRKPNGTDNTETTGGYEGAEDRG